MGLKSMFRGLGRWLFGKAKLSVASNKDEIFADLEGMAIKAVSSVAIGNRKAAVSEIIKAAKTTGHKWGENLLAGGEKEVRDSLLKYYTDSDLKRYLGLARLTVDLAASLAPDDMPSTHVLLGLIQAALIDQEEN